jgi:hypothetical protein
VSPVDALLHGPPAEDGRNEMNAPLTTMDDLTNLLHLSIQDLNRETYIRMILELNQLNAAKSEQLLRAQLVVDQAIDACFQLATGFKYVKELVGLTPTLRTRRVSRTASRE